MGILSEGEGSGQKPTVHVRISDGLGNQMFCAAAAIALAHRLNANLVFGIYEYARDQLRKYELDRFQLGAHTYSGPRWKFSSHHMLLRNLRNQALQNGQLPTTIWRQRGFHFNDDFDQLSGNVYLRGTFQSYRYFDTAADLVRCRFNLKPQLSERGKELALAACGENTIAVHIRRGDYTKYPDTFPLLNEDYYRKAIGLITNAVPDTRLFVVTDDIAAAKSTLAEWPDATYAEGTNHFDDMNLISACRHRVIANSSFSWWGAWLDPRVDGLTVAPRKPFSRNFMMINNLIDYLAPNWIAI